MSDTSSPSSVTSEVVGDIDVNTITGMARIIVASADAVENDTATETVIKDPYM